MKLFNGLLVTLLATPIAFAQNFYVDGTIKRTITLPAAANTLSARPIEKEISFINFHLSPSAKQTITLRAERAIHEEAALYSGKYPRNVQLRMNNVPVLDQGIHGTCVTFANTAAIDAVLNKGDYVSQLCPLLLSQYLENVTYETNAWEGSFGPIVLNQLSLFGLVSKEQQKSHGCAGLTDYPINKGIPDAKMTPEDYHSISEKMDPQVVSWSPVFDPYQVLDDKIDMQNALDDVKAALANGDRLTFGVLLADSFFGVAGAVGTYHVGNDTWVLTPEIAEHLSQSDSFPGHEMIITGYDNDAVAVDSQGRSYQGLLTLRNSWGNYAGDQGNYYMTYNYFKALALEAQRIRHIAK